ncbi:hypothetical protein B484DRAFT_482334 [Ochromonadaceae sp. CCMP2298]|nr:hypothetical protein B484DRAFT_482334 [Ochromonadaceae sp. CCMP2298]
MPEVKVRGGWAAGSTVTEQNYRRNPEGRGAFAVAGDGGEFTHQQLEGLTRKPLAACPSLSSDEDVADDDRYDMGVEDEWDCGTGTGESEGVEGLLQDLLGPERGAALDGGLPSEPRVVVPCVVDGPPVGPQPQPQPQPQPEPQPQPLPLPLPLSTPLPLPLTLPTPPL